MRLSTVWPGPVIPERPSYSSAFVRWGVAFLGSQHTTSRQHELYAILLNNAQLLPDLEEAVRREMESRLRCDMEFNLWNL